MLLSINIPTYERLKSFSSVLIGLAVEIDNLDDGLKKLIKINVFDNDSTCYMLKDNLCKELRIKFNLNIFFNKNEYNIGGDANIHNCYLASPDAIFTWVLGDDEHIISGALRYITDILQSFADDLGLLILSAVDNEADLGVSELRVYESYSELARSALKEQPQVLIAHTLISCNIIKSTIFSEKESLYSRNTLYLRYLGLDNYGFAHMRGMLFGLLRSGDKVVVGGRRVIDTTRQEPGGDFGVGIFDVYYFHLLWLSSEVGVRVDQIKAGKSMLWLSRGMRFELMCFWVKIKWKERLRHVLIKLLGKNVFEILRARKAIKQK